MFSTGASLFLHVKNIPHLSFWYNESRSQGNGYSSDQRADVDILHTHTLLNAQLVIEMYTHLAIPHSFRDTDVLTLVRTPRMCQFVMELYQIPYSDSHNKLTRDTKYITGMHIRREWDAFPRQLEYIHAIGGKGEMMYLHFSRMLTTPSTHVCIRSISYVYGRK
jgi:hypothetical protein